MRLSALAREAFRNLRSGTTRVGLFFGVSTALISGLCAAEVTSVLAILEASEKYRDSGASVLIVTAEGQISGALCEQLADVDGVRAAGAIQEADEKLAALALPDSPIPLYEVSPGFPSLLTRHDPTIGGLTLGEDAATALGVGPGDSVDSFQGVALVAETYDYPVDGRRIGYSFAALQPSSDERAFDECWVDAWPPLDGLENLLLTAVQPSAVESGERPQLSRLNARMGETFDGPSRFAARLTGFSALLAGVLSFAVGWFAVRLRRLELASALHSGVRRGALTGMLLLEAAFWIVPASLVALTVSTLAASAAPDGLDISVLVLGLRILYCGAIAAFAGTACGMATVRERHLFRYFKDR